MLPDALSVPLSDGMFVAIALVVATASYLLVERPFLAHGRASKVEPAKETPALATISASGAEPTRR